MSGVSSGWRVTGPPVNQGLFADSAGISLGLSTFAIGVSSLRFLGLLLSPRNMVDSVTFGVSRRLLYQILDRFCNHPLSPMSHVGRCRCRCRRARGPPQSLSARLY